MTPERFAHLAEAYGADLRHWPADERDSARALIAHGDESVQAALEQAAWLDHRLDLHLATVPDAALMHDVMASARRVERPSFWQRYADWLSSLGFVGVGLAGVAAGMLVASLSLPLSGSQELLPSVFDQGDTALMIGIDTEESEE
ncbi:hypothetical protein [Pseudomonas sp. SLFW]|uniref:hypothetical protein n=1 Tax=Pseudomonas sp. SLFW TaxID=2683259 RepID=UPI0014121E36|nr:hypothetical protein [Pseudomonas sp. SLFW]NBB12216.1 hypothetical protein [Pseudomonas sp. SLFW]